MENKPTYETADRRDFLRDNSNDRAYFSMMPNMLDDELDPYQYRLYGHYKRVCGESGVCWQSIETTAQACRMSVGKVSSTKYELDAMGLIDITEVPRPAGGRPYHEVRIVDIWHRNIIHCADASSRREVPSSRDELASSPGEVKKNPLEEEPTKEEEEGRGATAPAPPVDLWPDDVADRSTENPAREQITRMRSKMGTDPLSVAAHCQEQQAVEGAWTVPAHHGLSSACAAYRRVYEFSPKKYQRKTIDETVNPDDWSIRRWEEVCQAWADLGWNPTNIKGMLDYYVLGQIPDTRPKRGNGRHDKQGPVSHIVTEDECVHLTEEQEAEFMAAYRRGEGDEWIAANVSRV